MGLFSFSSKSKINWIPLTEDSQLSDLIERSNEVPVVFFKHSTRCGISSMAKNRFESEWDLDDDEIIPVYLDLLKYRSLSNRIEAELNVFHQSPQAIVIKNGERIYDASHSSISVSDIKELL